MSGITELDELLKSMSPELDGKEYVFCQLQGQLADYLYLNPLCIFEEAEGLTVIISKENAITAGLAFEAVFKRITLMVHSSLEAVGLTAAVATKLTKQGISANVVAAYYHDHVFVQSDKAESALIALQELTLSGNGL